MHQYSKEIPKIQGIEMLHIFWRNSFYESHKLFLQIDIWSQSISVCKWFKDSTSDHFIFRKTWLMKCLYLALTKNYIRKGFKIAKIICTYLDKGAAIATFAKKSQEVIFLNHWLSSTRKQFVRNIYIVCLVIHDYAVHIL